MVTVTQADIERDTALQNADTAHRTAYAAYNKHFDSHACNERCAKGNDLWHAYIVAKGERERLYAKYGFNAPFLNLQ